MTAFRGASAAWALRHLGHDILMHVCIRQAGDDTVNREDINAAAIESADSMGVDGEAYPPEQKRSYVDTGSSVPAGSCELLLSSFEGSRVMETCFVCADRAEKYYVMQVAPGTEAHTEALIKARVDEKLYGRCFHPLRHVRKKFRGEWKDCHEKLIPGYVFFTSGCIEALYQKLKRVPTLTKVLGHSENELFIPLAAGEVEWLEKMMADGTEVLLSRVEVSEGDTVTVLEGPLKDMEGNIRKINLHRRIAEVEVEFMGRKTVIHLGIELVGKDSLAGLNNVR